jgi:hypothetical protein
VLVCRLVDGKITYVHRRLWPALVRLSERFPHTRLAQIREVHTVSGKHVVEEIRFPAWVSREVAAQASDLDEESALRQLGPWCTKGDPIRKGARREIPECPLSRRAVNCLSGTHDDFSASGALIPIPGLVRVDSHWARNKSFDFETP